MSKRNTAEKKPQSKPAPVDVDAPIPYRLTDAPKPARKVTLDSTIREIMSLGPREQWTAREIIGDWYTVLVIAEPVLAGVLRAHESEDDPERGELVALLMLAHRALALFDAEQAKAVQP